MNTQSDNRSTIELQYEIVANRRLGIDTMMWQAPVLSLTAQAFLMTIALAADTALNARYMAAFLSVVVSVLSMQLMSKHRRHEMRDSRWLERFEKEYANSGFVVAHRKPDTAATWNPLEWFAGLSSYNVWMGGLMVFLAAGLLILVRPEYFTSPTKDQKSVSTTSHSVGPNQPHIVK